MKKSPGKLKMTSKIDNRPKKLIHIARILGNDGKWQYLYLWKMDERQYFWALQDKQDFGPVSDWQVISLQALITAQTIEEALRIASNKWQSDYFCTLNCGFRYTLPERDEHGINALFHQMAASYSSSNGIYYDEELGNNCFVQNASEEAIEFLRQKVIKIF